MLELFINPLALTVLRHGNKGRTSKRGTALSERSYEPEHTKGTAAVRNRKKKTRKRKHGKERASGRTFRC